MKYFIFAFLLSTTLQAKKLKIAVLVPEGTSWANSLADMSKEIKKQTNGKVKLKIYYGGVAGDEPDVLRKIRIGQLQGGFFSGKTLGEIYPDIRAIEIPFTFHDKREVAWKKLQSMKDYFNKGLEENKFVNLGFYEIGMVYVVSTKPVANLQEFKGKKIWAWEGDQLVKAMVDSMGLVSVPLALPDVLSSLSTGIIDSAYAPPSAIIALQWQTRVKYLIDYPVAFSIGALLIDAKAWKKISPVNQKIIQTLAKKYIDQTNKQTILDNQSSLSFLKENGVKFIKFPKEDIERSQPIRKDVISKIKGKVISNAAIEML